MLFLCSPETPCPLHKESQVDNCEIQVQITELSSMQRYAPMENILCSVKSYICLQSAVLSTVGMHNLMMIQYIGQQISSSAAKLGQDTMKLYCSVTDHARPSNLVTIEFLGHTTRRSDHARPGNLVTLEFLRHTR